MRMLVLGLDGAPPHLIERWVSEGHLPTFQQLIGQGAWGRLTSIVPPLTPPAWTSSVTGQNPGKHNVFDFTRPTQFVTAQSTYRHPFIDPTDRQAKAVWEYLNEAGVTAGVLTFPFTYPPLPVQGCMFSELWGVENDYLSHPKELVAEVAHAVPRWFTRVGMQDLPEGDFQAIEQKIHHDLEARFDVLRYLLQHHPTDFTFAVFLETDTAQHYFWQFMDETHPWHDGQSSFRHTLLRLYQRIDEMLAQLLNEMGSDTLLVIYSDHGFGPLVYNVCINIWLVENGFMALKEAEQKNPPLINRVMLGRLARKLGLLWLTRHIPEGVKARVPMPAGEFDLFEQIDWERTRVYFNSLASQSLMVNLRGREPRGIVSPDEHARICEEVVAGLKTLRHPETGEPLITAVYRREEVYHGPYVSHAPDIIAQCAPGYALAHGVEGALVQSARKGATPLSGTHAPEGMALLWGPTIRKTTFQANLMDIAPTLLHAFGLPIPDIDGRVLHEVFAASESTEAAPPVESDTPDSEETSPYSPEQEKKLTERLRRLGYL